MQLDRFRKANLDSWNERADIHAASKFYGIDRYITDPDHISRTVEFDKTELGDVSGKSLLHLQCHIGTDTISLARLGANVTGVDFSETSIDHARELSQKSRTPAEFVVCELYDTPRVINRQFEIVYTGIGALVWLPDIRGWAKVVASLLKPGGTFYIRDGHPMSGTIDDERDDGLLVVSSPYFETKEGTRFDNDVTYTDGPSLSKKTANYEWNHGIGEIVTSLIESGLQIEFLHEHQFAEYHAFPACVGDGEGHWRFPDHPERLPMLFSLKATKPG